MLIVGTDQTVVEADLMAGRLACPECGTALRPWRAICPGCAKTHVLVSEASLVRRRDAVEVFGTALGQGGGVGTSPHRRHPGPAGHPRWGGVAAPLRLRGRAHRAHFTRWLMPSTHSFPPSARQARRSPTPGRPWAVPPAQQCGASAPVRPGRWPRC